MNRFLQPDEGGVRADRRMFGLGVAPGMAAGLARAESRQVAVPRDRALGMILRAPTLAGRLYD